MDIKMLVMDVDGTLTDGRIYYASNGVEVKAFDIRDGYAIKHVLPLYGIIPVIITGRSSSMVSRRAAELGIQEVYQGVSDKLSAMNSVMRKYDLKGRDVAYIGDDLIDIDCMYAAGYVGCPADAAHEVLVIADYVCKRNGGDGAVREFIEYIIGFKREEGEDAGKGTLG